MLDFFSRLNKPEDFSSRTVLTFKPDVPLLWFVYFFCCVTIAIKNAATGDEFCANPETPTKLALRNFHLNKQDGQSVNRKGLVMVKGKG